MTPSQSFLEPTPSNLGPALFYGLGTLLLLILGSGGDPAQSSARLPLFGGLLLLWAAWGSRRAWRRLSWNPGHLAVGTGVGLASGALTLVVCLFIHKQPLNGSTMDLMWLALLVGPASELLHRGLLQPTWGLSGVAFLEALSWGLGWQHLTLFLSTWLIALLNGFVARRFGLDASLPARIAFGLVLYFGLSQFT